MYLSTGLISDMLIHQPTTPDPGPRPSECDYTDVLM